MQNKIITLAIAFVVLFSLQGFCQTNEKSKHPLLDKYYPQKQEVVDTAKTLPVQNPVAETRPAPAITTTPAPAVKTTPVMTSVTTPAMASTNIPTITTQATDTSNAVSKPTAAIVQSPVQKVQASPPSPPYMDTRLGSSTKQYDTWEKNANGAGSVTTSPK
jgi:hypothetical protein